MGGFQSIAEPKKSFFNYGPVCEFIPSKPNWFEGEDFNGILHLQLDNGSPILQVNIVIDGFEHTHWTEQRSYGSGKHRRTVTIHFRNALQSVSTAFTIMQSPDGFARGDFKFPVNFKMPTGIPGTFIYSNYGK